MDNELSQISKEAYRYRGLLIVKAPSKDVIVIETYLGNNIIPVRKWQIVSNPAAGLFNTIEEVCDFIDTIMPVLN